MFLMNTKRMGRSLEAKNEIDLSVPFDLKEESSIFNTSGEDEVLEEDKSLAAERRRSKVVTEEDFLMEIKAHPGEAMPVIRYIQYKIEISETDAPRKIFYEFLPRT